METVYTPEEIAEQLKLASKTVYRLLQGGKLKGLKIGRLWRVRESDLKMFLDAGANLGSEPKRRVRKAGSK